MNVIVFLGIIFLLSFIVESFTEYFFGKLFEKIPRLQPYQWTLQYIAAVIGVAGAFIYKFDLLFLLATYLNDILKTTVEFPSTWFGILLTGLAIGRGSNYIHQIISTWFKKPDVP